MSVCFLFRFRDEADRLRVHRNYEKASFEKLLAVACEVRSRRWAELEEKDGGRLQLHQSVGIGNGIYPSNMDMFISPSFVFVVQAERSKLFPFLQVSQCL